MTDQWYLLYLPTINQSTASGFSFLFISSLERDFLILRKAVLIEMVRVKKRRVGAAPLWPMSSHKPDPSLVSFPVFFLEWKRMNGFPLCTLTIFSAYSVRETSHTVPSSKTFAGLASGIHANKRSKCFAYSL